MAMINLDMTDIILDVYNELIDSVILKNVPKDCPNITDIRANYLYYLTDTYKSHKPMDNKEELKAFILSQQREMWSDQMIYNIYRSFVKDLHYDSLVRISTLSFRLAHMAHLYDLELSRAERDRTISTLTEIPKHIKPCFKEYAKEFATEAYKDIMYASGDRSEMSDRLKETIEMEKS